MVSEYSNTSTNREVFVWPDMFLFGTRISKSVESCGKIEILKNALRTWITDKATAHNIKIVETAEGR